MRRSFILMPSLSALSLAALLVSACAVGPDFTASTPAAPSDWTRWRSSDAALHMPVEAGAALSPEWWRAFNDPVLDELIARGQAASPDLQTAALRFAQARAQRGVTAAAALPQVNANAQVSRQRQSESGAATRTVDAIASDNRDAIAELLGEPFDLYQTRADLSWEIDLWGRVRRSLEAADADVARQAALLDAARLSLIGDLTRQYFQLRATQTQIRIARDDIALLREQTALRAAQVEGGLDSHLPLEQQNALLHEIEAQLPGLLAEEAAHASQIALLTGDHPGALNALLQPVEEMMGPNLPSLALGLPSDVGLRRPDVRAAEARLHAATASIGVARAELYPSIRLGAGFGFESYRRQNLFDWASRTSSIGPIIDLPLFDGGRRMRVVQLRELEQKQAAVEYQQTVLQAWQEIDDALNAYAGERRRNERLSAQTSSARAAYDLANARYQGGLTSGVEVIDARRAFLRALLARRQSDHQQAAKFAMVQQAIGNGP